MKTEQRLRQLGLELAKETSPIANYVNAVRTGNLLYLAGKGPGLPGHPLPVGKVGRDFTKEQGYEYARQTGLSLIAVMKAELVSGLPDEELARLEKAELVLNRAHRALVRPRASVTVAI